MKIYEAEFKIVRDYINTGQAKKIRKVLTGLPPAQWTKKDFRLYDDDGNLYYTGQMDDDDYCEIQEEVLIWAMNFAGCTKITVRETGSKKPFTQEIC